MIIALRALAALIRVHLNHPDYLTEGEIRELRDVARTLDMELFPGGRPEEYK